MERTPDFGRISTPELAVVLTIALLPAGCGKFESSPYALPTEAMPHDLNELNRARLAAREPYDDDTVTIVFTGDIQRFYEQQEAIVAKANTIPGVDMFIIAGDVTDFGLGQEFLWVYERMERLNMPWFAVPGNHDLQANGSLVFQQFFGPLDWSFQYKGYKFLLHDTNSREYGFNGTVPRLDLLATQLQDPAPHYFIALSHVAPLNADFDPDLAEPYMDLLGSDPRTILSLHGHAGSFEDVHYNDDDVRYILSNAVNWPVFLVLRIHDGRTWIEHVSYEE